LKQNDLKSQSIAILRVAALTEQLMDQLMIDTGITPESVNYDKTLFAYGMQILQGESEQ